MSITQILVVAILSIGLGGAAGAQVVDPANDPPMESHVKAFLNVLNSGTGKPMEQLSPKDARAVLTGAQNSVKVDLSGIDVTERVFLLFPFGLMA